MTKLRLDLEWRTTALTLVLLPALLGLGLWQLQRGDEKAEIGGQWEQRKSRPPVPLPQTDVHDAEQLKYLSVMLSGQFLDDRYFLLDNRIHQGKFGYEVLGVLQLDNPGRSVLVNRGWIAGDSSRQSLPVIPPVSGPVTLKGHVYVAPGAPYLLADVELEAGWPKRIQAIEMDKLVPVMKTLSGASPFPYPVRIDPHQPGALTVDWQVINVRPEKHTAYAVQWFTMAVALSIFFILRSSNLWQVITKQARNNVDS